MCLDEKCKTITIVEMECGRKMYIHYDKNLIPMWIEYCNIKFKPTGIHFIK